MVLCHLTDALLYNIPAGIRFIDGLIALQIDLLKVSKGVNRDAGRGRFENAPRFCI